MKHAREKGKMPQIEADEDEIQNLSGNKPFFDVVFGTSQVHYPYTMFIPSKFTRDHLPDATVHAVLKYGGKNWTVTYTGDSDRPKFAPGNWKPFVIDNNLQPNDACVFELVECSTSKLTFNVIILRDEVPPELQTKIDLSGKAPEAPIVVD